MQSIITDGRNIIIGKFDMEPILLSQTTIFVPLEMVYRRKVILSLLQKFDGNLSKVSLQKLLFLFANRQIKPSYEFVPYKYGSFSFSANADLSAMVRRGELIEDLSGFAKVCNLDYISMLTDKDKDLLDDVKRYYGNMTEISLMKFTYLNYQYYAINSICAKDILNEEQYRKIEEARPFNDQTVLYTIGYEGISLEMYLNRLIKNDVKVLVDVRCNALSMKYGFSKSQLKTFCNNLNIDYVHIPEVGIKSEQRQELKSQADYDKLFENYRCENLNETRLQQQQIFNLLVEKNRIALTCFEANICQCHRKYLAEELLNHPSWGYQLKHI